jgi:glucan phosphoethanolaminetransferase (alkaline phosphatase superfamily)
MVCLKYRTKEFFCVKKSILWGLFYAALIAFILLSADKIYAASNEYFFFDFQPKEFFKMLLLAALISMISKRKIRLGIYLLLLFFSLLQYVHFSYFGKNIGAIEFYLFFTNVAETFETLGAMLSMLFIPLSIVIVSFALIFTVDLKLGHRAFKYKYGLSVLLAGILIVVAQTFYVTNIKESAFKQSDNKLIYPLVNRHSARNFFISMNYFITGILPKKLFAQSLEFPILEKPKRINSDVNRTIILIIGESLRYDTFALYDNKLTPKLQSLKLQDSHFMNKKIYAGGTMTKVSVATLINRLKYPSTLQQINNEENCLFKLAKENGFGTYFLSAQRDKNLEMIRDMICPKSIDSLITRDTFETYMVPSGYDEDLKALLQQLDILNQNNLIVMQQRGSHSPYEKQYPAAFNQYSPYENTAFYTDTTLYDLISMIKERARRETFVFYVSDHGELIGENGKQGHGTLEQPVYEVPFLMYSNSDSEAPKNIFKAIKSHYDLSNYILHLLGYEAEINQTQDREIYVLNSDLEGFSGYGVVKIKDSVEGAMQMQRH